MHTLVFVLVPPATKSIRSEVERLLGGSEVAPNKPFEQVEKACSCIGRQARSQSYRDFDQSAVGIALKARLNEARQAKNRPAEEALLIERYRAVNELEEKHPAFGQVNPNCGLCKGTGVYSESRDPRLNWDYWSIGGRWSKLFNDVTWSVVHNQELHHNIAIVETIPETIMQPPAVVTPDGNWHEGPLSGDGGIFAQFRREGEIQAYTDWQEELSAILTRYADHIAVVVDCHS